MPASGRHSPSAGRQSRSKKAPVDVNSGPEPRLVTLQRDAAVAFYEADKDGSGCLDWEEFKAAPGGRLGPKLSERELREIFDEMDTDKSGTISLDEFFLYTLAAASHNTGSGIEAIFRKYDRNKEGALDAVEFSRACEDMGYGSMAHDLFLELDHDESGSVAYQELMDMLKSRCTTVGRNAKLFLTSLSFDRASGDGAGTQIDPSSWCLKPKSVAELRTELQARLLQSSARVSDLYYLLTRAHSVSLTKTEFLMAMYRIGFEGDSELIFKLFADCDLDHSGIIGLEELYAFMNHRHTNPTRAKELTFKRRSPEDPPLSSLAWSPATLRSSS